MTDNAVVNNILKPLRAHFKPNVKEFMMNKPCEVILELSDGKSDYKKDKALNYSWFKSFATIMSSMTGQVFNSSTSILSFKLPGGHRVQITHGESTKYDFGISIRLYRGLSFKLEDFKISKEDKEEIIKAVTNKENLLISGGTSTGKTSFLNCLINNFVELESRIITIEGVEELIIKHHKNVLALYYQENQANIATKNSNKASDLLNASLRMRPDRIIMGELRQENSFVFVRAINTGHEGSMATIHANSPENAISAIKENIILNGDAASGAMDILDIQLRRNIYGVIQLEKLDSGGVGGYFKKLAS